MQLDQKVVAQVEPMQENRLILLGGCPRSGTTLVQNILDSHPDVLGGPEFLHLVDIMQLRSKLLISVEKEWISLFCSAAEVDAYIRGFVEKLLLPLADKNNSKLLSEKSPDNVQVLFQLAEVFPNAKIVHIVRDPRAVVASLLKTAARAREKGESPAPFARDASSAISYTSRCLRSGFEAATRKPEQVYTLVYERLVEDPEAETKKLCDFLDLPWSDAMLDPAGKEHLGEAAITVNSNEIWYDKDTYYSNPNTDRLTKWREELAPYAQILANRRFASHAELKQLGYDFSGSELSTVSKLLAYPYASAIRFKYWLVKGARRFLGRLPAG